MKTLQFPNNIRTLFRKETNVVFLCHMHEQSKVGIESLNRGSIFCLKFEGIEAVNAFYNWRCSPSSAACLELENQSDTRGFVTGWSVGDGRPDVQVRTD